MSRDRLFERRGVDAAVIAGNEAQPRAGGEEFHCATFVLDHMRAGVAVHISVGRRQGRQAQGVGRGAGGHDEGAHRRAEEFAERRIEFTGPRIIAVGFLRPIVGGRDRGEQFGSDACGIVAVEGVGR